MARKDLESSRDKESCLELSLTPNRSWYARNKKTELAKLKERRKADPLFADKCRLSAKRSIAKKRERLEKLKDAPCTDCGERFPPECMDFDHRDPQTKTSKVAGLISSRLDRLLAEIAKCDLICANCHRIRTRTRRQGVTRKSLNV